MFQEQDRKTRIVNDSNVLLSASDPVKVLHVIVYPVEAGAAPWRFVCPSDWNPEGSCGFIAFRRLDGILSLLNSRDVMQIDISVARDAVAGDYEETSE
jgi:hypothetical protein